MYLKKKNTKNGHRTLQGQLYHSDIMWRIGVVICKTSLPKLRIITNNIPIDYITTRKHYYLL